MLKTKWAAFRQDKLPSVLQFVNYHAKLISGSRAKDYQVWKRGNADLQTEINSLRNWLNARATFLDTCIKGLSFF